ncbi:MAG: FAD-dependent oxidoreductase [Planctomycetes bacterium]|nr:FAD-dependent oxidoreductase [Planctomycetota bacterium]
MSGLNDNGNPDSRIEEHPILDAQRLVGSKKDIHFTFDGKNLPAKEGETISTALFANNIHIFGHHFRDNAPQGIYCANGQCSQCLVIADGSPVKSCIVPVKDGMDVRSMVGLPELIADDKQRFHGETIDVETDILIIGGGPAGLSAALELAPSGKKIIITDDKLELGGKLTLQTHNFFGSIADCYAGTRGMDIGYNLSEEVQKFDNVEIWLDSPAVGVFSDKKVGIVRKGSYINVKPEILMIATGAREKNLIFPGADLPNVYGAGAFQTLVNRDLIRTSEKILIVGGGNVGLIGAYHALQANMEVVAVIEALPKCGGYKVHEDKIRRLGVPILTSHTILAAEGKDRVERVIIAGIDQNFKVIEGTEKEFDVDTVLIAVGLSPVNELLEQAIRFGMKVYGAGDAEVIAEASAAIFSGKITGRQILLDITHDEKSLDTEHEELIKLLDNRIELPQQHQDMLETMRIEILKALDSKNVIPKHYMDMLEIMRGKPGKTFQFELPKSHGNKFYPVIRCQQEIPCNPCTEVCPMDSIKIPSGHIMELPMFAGECIGCGRCVQICPGLAINLVVKDGFDPEGKTAGLVIPWEIGTDAKDLKHIPNLQAFTGNREIVTVDYDGNVVGKGKVLFWKLEDWLDRRILVFLEVPIEDADKVASMRLVDFYDKTPENYRKSTQKEYLDVSKLDDDAIICRCERVTKKEIMDEIKNGARDFNDIKAVLRLGMGPCGSKTCSELTMRLFREAGIDLKNVQEHSKRPFEMEIPLKSFLDEKDID